MLKLGSIVTLKDMIESVARIARADNDDPRVTAPP